MWLTSDELVEKIEVHLQFRWCNVEAKKVSDKNREQKVLTLG